MVLIYLRASINTDGLWITCYKLTRRNLPKQRWLFLPSSLLLVLLILNNRRSIHSLIKRAFLLRSYQTLWFIERLRRNPALWRKLRLREVVRFGRQNLLLLLNLTISVQVLALPLRLLLLNIIIIISSYRHLCLLIIIIIIRIIWIIFWRPLRRHRIKIVLLFYLIIIS